MENELNGQQNIWVKSTSADDIFYLMFISEHAL